jgi:hypothetical protein
MASLRKETGSSCGGGEVKESLPMAKRQT